MKNAIIVLSILFIPLFFSCTNTNTIDNKFLGTWKNNKHDSITVNIKKDGDKFMVATLLNGKVSSTLPHLLKDSILTPEVVLLPGHDLTIHMTTSGRLSWGGIEWEKISK